MFPRVRLILIAALLAVQPALAAAQVSSYAFIANFNSHSVSVIDSASNTVIKTIG